MKHTDLYDDVDWRMCEELDIHYEDGEILPPFATVTRNKEFNLCIAVCPDTRHRKGHEHFRVYHHFFAQDADKIARISFHSPEYVISEHSTKERWILNQEQKTRLQWLLTHDSDEWCRWPGNLWQNLIAEYNFQLHEDVLPLDLPLPDYENML